MARVRRVVVSVAIAIPLAWLGGGVLALLLLEALNFALRAPVDIVALVPNPFEVQGDPWKRLLWSSYTTAFLATVVYLTKFDLFVCRRLGIEVEP